MSRETRPSTTSRSEDFDSVSRAVPALAVVVECDRLNAGGALVPVGWGDRIVIGRGAGPELMSRRERAGELRVDLPDAKASSEHARLEPVGGRDNPRFRLVDLGSKNGTFVGAEKIQEREIGPGELFRVGHTVLSLLPDASIEDGEARAQRWPFRTLIGSFRRDLDRLSRIAATPIPLLFLGETGTGKEILARATHERSGRAGRFVAVNCAALPATLVESQLFGHQRGAFSGAVRDEIGFFRHADGGTLLLDEIGDLPLAAQAALLRVLQEGEVTPVGAFAPVKVNARVLAATHKPLEAMVQAGQFRADLYARLSGFVFAVPPLRERLHDLGILFERILLGRPSPPRIRPEVALALLEHRFPHNVRELVQIVDASFALAEGGVVRLADLPAHLREPQPQHASIAPPPTDLSAEDIAIREELTARLAAHGGNVSQVARDMGKARQQIQRWMRRFGLRGSDG